MPYKCRKSFAYSLACSFGEMLLATYKVQRWWRFGGLPAVFLFCLLFFWIAGIFRCHFENGSLGDPHQVTSSVIQLWISVCHQETCCDAEFYGSFWSQLAASVAVLAFSFDLLCNSHVGSDPTGETEASRWKPWVGSGLCSSMGAFFWVERGWVMANKKFICEIICFFGWQAGFSFVRPFSQKLFEKDQVCKIQDLELNPGVGFLVLFHLDVSFLKSSFGKMKS